MLSENAGVPSVILDGGLPVRMRAGRLRSQGARRSRNRNPLGENLSRNHRLGLQATKTGRHPVGSTFIQCLSNGVDVMRSGVETGSKHSSPLRPGFHERWRNAAIPVPAMPRCSRLRRRQVPGPGSEPVRSVASRSSSDAPGPRATDSLLVGFTPSLQAHLSLDKTAVPSVLKWRRALSFFWRVRMEGEGRVGEWRALP